MASGASTAETSVTVNMPQAVTPSLESVYVILDGLDRGNNFASYLQGFQ